MTPRAADLLSPMLKKAQPDLSKFLLSPMQGLLSELAIITGQEIKAGQKLAVIEAMKIDILKADQGCVVAEIMAKHGDSLALDQPIAPFQ